MTTNQFAALQSENEMHRLYAEVGLESITSFTGFLSDFHRSFSTSTASFFKSAPEIEAPDNLPKELIRQLEKQNYHDVGKIAVFQPIGLTDFVRPYAIFLTDLLQRLSNMEVRLYQPIEKYISQLMSNPEASDEIWVDRDLALLDVEAEVKTFASFFDKQLPNKHTTGEKLFEELYVNNRDFIRTGTAMKELEGVVKGIDLKKIQKAEESLSRTVKMYIDIAKKDDSVITTNKQSLKKLAQALDHAAKETELFSVAYYAQQTLSSTFNLSVERLTTALK